VKPSAVSALLAVSLASLACASHYVSNRVPSSAVNPALFPGEVWGPEEDALAKRILESSVETARKNASGGIVRRDAHPKHHGCVRAQWKTGNVESKVGRQAGIFSETGAEYDAWVRFSNGSPSGATASDADADVRGLAVKLMGVKGTPIGSQDFVMMTSPRFFSKDAADYMKLHEALTQGGLSLVKYLAMNPRNAIIVNGARIKMENPLAPTYFSPVPSRIGDSSMRFKMVPCGAVPPAKDKKNPDFLRQALVDTLAARSACFDFYVQVNENPQRNPIEDPRLDWDEAESPFFLAGRLTIPKQSGIDSPEQLAFCENVSFSPWNTQDELRPLGQINRIRKIVYDGVAAFRRGENHVTPGEPVNHDPCHTPASASLCQAR
jgi:hypothetical protein